MSLSSVQEIRNAATWAARAASQRQAPARGPGHVTKIEGDEGGDLKRQRTDDSNSEESVASDSSDENRFGVRYKGHSTNNAGATQGLYKRWTINRRCKVWKPHRTRTNDFPSKAVANAKGLGSLVAKLLVSSKKVGIKSMRMIAGLEAENADLHMQLKAAAKKIEELEAAAAASKKIEELKAAAKKIEELSVHFSVMQVLLDPA